ncbi:MAG TPA: hypothetical protein VNG12_05110, partial [Acidimicrobiales bacterium]|nr:hypothetical protein [Acidimicrobiales bacterium]
MAPPAEVEPATAPTPAEAETSPGPTPAVDAAVTGLAAGPRNVPEHGPLDPSSFDDSAQPDFLRHAVFGLRDSNPDLSADHTFSRRQKVGLIVCTGVLILSAVVALRVTEIGLISLCTLLYLAAILFRLNLWRHSLRASRTADIHP